MSKYDSEVTKEEINKSIEDVSKMFLDNNIPINTKPINMVGSHVLLKERNNEIDKKRIESVTVEFEGDRYKAVENFKEMCEGCDLEGVDCITICSKITDKNYILKKVEE